MEIKIKRKEPKAARKQLAVFTDLRVVPFNKKAHRRAFRCKQSSTGYAVGEYTRLTVTYYEISKKEYFNSTASYEGQE